MATYGNTGGSGLSINVYSGSGGNLNEWALDYDGLKLLTIPEVITASNITTNQTVTITLKAKPIFNNISVSFFRVKLPDGSIAEYPAINNTAIFTTPIAGALGSQQTLLVYARDNSGNRSAVASHLYTVVNSLPPSTSAITHNIPSSFSAGDVKQIQISGAVDPEGDPYTYSLILPPEISGSKISGIANNETVTLTVQNTIDYTKQDNIVIRVTDINGAQDDKVLTVTLLSGGSSGGTNNFNVRTSFPSSVYPNEVFTAKIWELGTNNYTYGLNLPSGVTASKTMGILSNENFTVTIAPNVAPNSTIGIDVVVYTGNVSVGSFVVNMLVDGVTGETSYTTPGSYEFTVPNTVNSLSMLEVYSDKITESQLGDGGFVIENLKEENLRRGQDFTSSSPGNTPMQLNNMILAPGGAGLVYTLDNFTTINTVSFPSLHIYTGAYGNGSYIVSGDIVAGDETEDTMLSVNNGLSWNKIPTASVMNGNKHLSIDFFNSTFYIARDNITHDILVSIDGGYTFINKQMPQHNRNYSVWDGVVCNKDGYLRVMFGTGADNRAHLLRTIDRCNTWTEITIPGATNHNQFGYFRCVNGRYMLISNQSNYQALITWSDDLLNWTTTAISLPTVDGVTTNGGDFGYDVIWFDGKYIFNNGTSIPYQSFRLDANMLFIGHTGMMATGTGNNAHTRQLVVNGTVLFGHRAGINNGALHKDIYLSAKSTDRINIDNLFGEAVPKNLAHFYNCNNEVVCLYASGVNYGYSSVSIKLTSPINNVNGAYLTNDFSSKNIVDVSTITDFTFISTTSCNNQLFALGNIGSVANVYKSTNNGITWEVIPSITNLYLQVGDASIVPHILAQDNYIFILSNADNSSNADISIFMHFWFSTDSGNTWYNIDAPVAHATVFKGKIYTISNSGTVNYVYKDNTETWVQLQLGGSTTSSTLTNLKEILVARDYSGSGNCYYLDENYLNANQAFKNIIEINLNYQNKIPGDYFKYRYIRNYNEDISVGYASGNDRDLRLYDTPILNLTINDYLNNQTSTINALTQNNRGIDEGITTTLPFQIRVYVDYLILFSGNIVSVSKDKGISFNSINVNSEVKDVVISNGIVYIFTANTVKKIVPSILDNSNIINKEPNIGYSLTNPKLAGNFGKNGYAKYLNNIEVTPGDKLNINVTSPDGGVRLVWGTNRFFPTNAS